MSKLIIATLLLAVGMVPAHAAKFLFAGSGAFSAGLSVNGVPGLSTDISQFTATVSNQGWWSSTASNADANDNYFVGDDDVDQFNNFFTFDLSSVSFPVTSASLVIVAFGTTTAGLPVTYSLWDVTTSAAVLNANDGTSSAIFKDLASGIHYGEVSVGPYPFLLEIPLNAAAIADINAAAGGFFSIGGTLSPIPEPATIALSGLSLLALSWKIRQKRK